VPHIESWEPCSLAAVPDGPQVKILNVPWLQKEGASPGTHVCVRPEPRIHTGREPRFPLPPHTTGTRGCSTALVGSHSEGSVRIADAPPPPPGHVTDVTDTI
jgi:hypothetical protein